MIHIFIIHIYIFVYILLHLINKRIFYILLHHLVVESAVAVKKTFNTYNMTILFYKPRRSIWSIYSLTRAQTFDNKMKVDSV